MTVVSSEKKVLGQRAIFMRNGQYAVCDVLVDQRQDVAFEKRNMLCRTPDGREFKAVPYLGTWCEVRPWDEQFEDKE